MEVIEIEILNPKVKALLKDLANMELIRIKKEDSPIGTKEILKRLRSKADQAPDLITIANEVDKVRYARYSKK